MDVPAGLLTKTTEARHLIARGEARYSGGDEFMVQLTREAASTGMSTTELAVLLGNGITRNSVIGLAHRVKPTILFFGTRHSNPMRAKTIAKRVTQRGNSSNLNPRLSRLMKEIKTPVSFIAGYRAPGAVNSVMSRRAVKPRCMWSGCECAPRAAGKPYCEAHDRSVKAAEPVDFSRRIW